MLFLSVLSTIAILKGKNLAEIYPNLGEMCWQFWQVRAWQVFCLAAKLRTMSFIMEGPGHIMHLSRERNACFQQSDTIRGRGGLGYGLGPKVLFTLLLNRSIFWTPQHWKFICIHTEGLKLQPEASKNQSPGPRPCKTLVTALAAWARLSQLRALSPTLIAL